MKDFLDTYLVLIIIFGIGMVLSFVWLYFFNKEKLHLKWWEAIITVIASMAAALGGLIFFALLEAGFNPSKAGNMSFFGGIFVLPLIVFVFSKIKKVKFSVALDIFTVPLLILSFGRINCLVTGCCYGNYIGNSDIRYPTREIELVYDGLFLALAIVLNLKNKFTGKIYYLHLAGYGFLRFIIEFMRHAETTSVFHIGHAWAILSLLIGAGMIIYLIVLEKNPPQPKKK